MLYKGGRGMTGAGKKEDKALSDAGILPITEARSLLSGGLGMARGRQTSLRIRLTPVDRQTLLTWQRSTTIPAGRARRGRIILQLADGVPISHIATAVGISRRFVYKWVQRFLQYGIEGLTDKRGRGRQSRSHPHEVMHQNGMRVG